jgi:hypothetical protein
MKAEYAGGYRILCEFSDGTSGTADLADVLWGPVFEPLKAKNKFRDFQVSPVFKTVVWSNGADVAPETLYDLAKQSTTYQPGMDQRPVLEVKEKKPLYNRKKGCA